MLSINVKNLTGLESRIKEMNVGALRTSVNIKGLKVLNPEKFIDKVMMDFSINIF